MDKGKGAGPPVGVPRTVTGQTTGPNALQSPRQRVELVHRIMSALDRLGEARALLSGPGMPREVHDAMASLDDAAPSLRVGAMSLLGDGTL